MCGLSALPILASVVPGSVLACAVPRPDTGMKSDLKMY